MENISKVDLSGLSLSGEVEFVLRDAVTGEVVQTEKKKNQVKQNLFIAIAGGGWSNEHYPPWLYLGTRKLRKGIRQVNVPGSYVKVPNQVTGLEHYAKVVLEDGTIALQISARNNPPAADVVWKGATIGTPTPGAYYAGTNFDNPCTQTTTTVLDVFYRILFKPSAVNGLPDWRIHRIVDMFIRYSRTYADTSWYQGTFIDNVVQTGMYPLPKYTPTDLTAGVFGGPYYSTLGNSGSTNCFGRTNYPQGSKWSEFQTIEYRHGVQNVLDFANVAAWRSFTKVPSTLTEGEWAVKRNVYNTFSHKIMPKDTDWALQDVDNMATGAGTVKFEGFWTDTAIPADGTFVEGTWPKIVQAVVNTSGKAADGSATYNLTERFLHDGKNLPIPVNTGNIGDNWLFPKMTNKVVDTNGIRAIKPYSDSITSLLLNDFNMVMVYNIPTGQYFKYKHPDLTNIVAVESSLVDGAIYIADSLKGLYTVNPKVAGSVVTKVTDSTNTVDLTSVFGVSVGKDNNVWVIANNGVGKLTKTTGMWSIFNDTSASPLTLASLEVTEWSKLSSIAASTTVDGNLILTNNTKYYYKYNPANTPVIRIQNETSYAINFVRSIRDGYFSLGHSVNYPNGSSIAIKFEDTTFSTSGVFNKIYLHDREGIFAQGRADPVSSLYQIWSYRKADGTLLSYEKPAIDLDLNSIHAIYLGDGRYIRLDYADDQRNIGFVMLPMNPTAADATATNTTKYGWNGTQWVKGLATGRPCHAVAQPTLWPGVTVKFTDSTTNPLATQFATTESYACVLYQGVFVDNATKSQFSLYQYFSLSNIVTANAITVPAAVTNTGPLSLIVSNDDEVYDSGSGVMKTRGDAGRVYLAFRNKPLIGSAWKLLMDTTGCAVSDCYDNASNNTTVFTLGVGYNTTATVDFSRADNILSSPLSVSYDGSTIKALPGTTYNTAVGMASATIPYFVIPDRILAGPLPTVSIDTNGSACLVPIGSQADNSGTYRDTYHTVDERSPENWVKLDGANIPIKYDNSEPAPGECAIPLFSGVIILNPADAGKTVSYNLRCVYME